MKTTCEKCCARYEIPDERVVGKVLRVRCKRCQNVMMAVGPTVAFEEGDAKPPTLTGIAAISGEGPSRSAPPRGLREDAEPIWWAGISGQPHGPYHRDEVLALIDRGDLHARSRLWRQPWAGWERICEAPGLGWAYERAIARLGEDAARVQGCEASSVFDRAGLLTDGSGWFPDPTMKSGWLILDEETQAYLETCAQRGMFAEHRAEDTPEDLAVEEAARAALVASKTSARPERQRLPSLRPAFAVASLALGIAATGLAWWASLSHGGV